MFDQYSICANCNELITWNGIAWAGETDTKHVSTDPRLYRSEKFGNDIHADILWRLSLDGHQDADLGEAETFGWFALFSEFSAILDVDCVGLVSLSEYNSPEHAKNAWQHVEDDYAEWLDEDENTYDDESDYEDMSDPYDIEYDVY